MFLALSGLRHSCCSPSEQHRCLFGSSILFYLSLPPLSVTSSLQFGSLSSMVRLLSTGATVAMNVFFNACEFLATLWKLLPSIPLLPLTFGFYLVERPLLSLVLHNTYLFRLSLHLQLATMISTNESSCFVRLGLRWHLCLRINMVLLIPRCHLPLLPHVVLTPVNPNKLVGMIDHLAP